MVGPKVNLTGEVGLVSCVVIFYNTPSRYLIEALAAVSNQSYRKFEIILVDDGSDDSETKVVTRDWASRHSNYSKLVFHPNHENRGMSASRNLGVSASSGEYIYFLDSDDTLEEDTFLNLVGLLKNSSDAGMAFGALRLWYSWSKDPPRDDVIIRLNLNPGGSQKRVQHIKSPTLFHSLLRQKSSITGFVVRRSVFEHVGGFEDSFKGHYEDQVFTSKVCLEYPVIYQDECYYNYRQHSDSFVMAAYDGGFVDWRKGRREFLFWLQQYLRQKDSSFSRVKLRVEIEIMKLNSISSFQLRLMRLAKRAWKHVFKR